MKFRTPPTNRWQFCIRHLLMGTGCAGLAIGLLRQLLGVSEMTREQRAVFATILMIAVYCGICGVMYSRLCGSPTSTAWIIGTLLAAVSLTVLGALTAAGV